MKRASVTPGQLQEAQRPLSGALKAEGGMQEMFEETRLNFPKSKENYKPAETRSSTNCKHKKEK